MLARQIREKYLKFFEGKGHKVIPSAPLIPENDPTVLFTTAGMHPLVPYLLGQSHPLGKRLVNSQKCIRTNDIDEVGDATHLTFFEMLGNWSLGDYFKKEAIEWSFDFLTRELNIPLEKLAITVFQGESESNVPRDEEAAEMWQTLGVSKERIAYLGRDDNWWGPAGKTGPCGPDTEMFYWIGTGSDPVPNVPKVFEPSDKRWVEIWNDVFMQYRKTAEGKFIPLEQKNVDTGMGLERITAVLQGKNNVYDTELFTPILEKIATISGKAYSGNEKSFRIIVDHIKAATFILAEGLAPSNVGRGYVLRRLIRRAVRYGKLLGIENGFTAEIAKVVIKMYEDAYPELTNNENFVFEELKKEEEKFLKTLAEGLKAFEGDKSIKEFGYVSGASSSTLFQTYGFPIEMIRELAKERGCTVDEKGFEEEMKKHQELSRTAAAGQFKSGLADNSEQTTKYHTATHSLLAALRKVLGGDIQQKGSNITAERLRFDFSFNGKLTKEEVKKIEDLVNEKIKENLVVVCEEMPLEQAKEKGAVGVFGHKYGEKVKVYSIGEFSKEICAGPHIQNTSELGEFKIIKEESVAAGVRRIKAVLK